MVFRDYVLGIKKQNETRESRFKWNGPYLGSADYI